MDNSALAILAALLLLMFHLAQVQMLSGSIGDFWRRRDPYAHASKILFGLSFCACGLIILSPIFGGFFAIALMGGSVGLSMEEWIKK